MISKNQNETNWQYYWKLGFDTVKELETERGILASGKSEIYGALFGRDSLITSLKLLRAYHFSRVPDLLAIVRKVLVSLMELQGQEFNINSGEEPGKIIHEYRPDNHEHLTQKLNRPWYVYPDRIMRNYDSIDSTPLFLITLARYLQEASPEADFEKQSLSSASQALDWLLNYADTNNDGFLDYILQPDREYGGLINQNWMDSTEATFHEDGTAISYPLAPVEAQAYAYLALRLWSNYLSESDPEKALKLDQRARSLKRQFNDHFIISSKAGIYIAAGIDGSGKKLESVRSSMGHCLWASLTKNLDGELDCIIDSQYIPQVIRRLLKADMFIMEAGIRTLSSNSTGFEANSYHNGSIWPHDSNIIADGMENHGYKKEADLIRKAVLKAIAHFKTPLELFVYDQTYQDYLSDSGQRSCQKQAWSAAAVLSSVAVNYRKKNFLVRIPQKLSGLSTPVVGIILFPLPKSLIKKGLPVLKLPFNNLPLKTKLDYRHLKLPIKSLYDDHYKRFKGRLVKNIKSPL